MLSGMHICYSLLLGSVVGWIAVGVPVYFAGWAPGPIMSYTSGVRCGPFRHATFLLISLVFVMVCSGWILWCGVAIMTADALTQLALSWRSVLNAFKSVAGIGNCSKDGCLRGLRSACAVLPCCRKRSRLGTDEESSQIDDPEGQRKADGLDKEDPVPPSEQIPWWSWIGGIVLSTIAIMCTSRFLLTSLLCVVSLVRFSYCALTRSGVSVAGYFVFSLMPYLTLLAVPLGCLLSMIAVRCAPFRPCF